VSRHRSRSTLNFIGGSAKALVPYLDDQQQGSFWKDEVCDDIVGNYPNPNPFYKTDRANVIGWVNGPVSHYYDCTNWKVTHNVYNWNVPAWQGLPDEQVALKGMAATNINSPAVNVPVFAFELRDLPGMVRHLGNRLIRVHQFLKGGGKRYSKELVSEDWLALNFGWRPLLADLGKMLDFVADVDKRISYLNRLYSKNGLRRIQTVYRKDVDMGHVDLYCGPLYSNQCRVRVYLVNRQRQWTSVHWKPASAPKANTDAEKLKLARKLCWGFYGFDPATAWQAMPWSWLADWFSDTGDFLEAHRNAVPVEAAQVCTMHKSEVFPRKHEYLDNPHSAKFSRAPGSLNSIKVRVVHSGLITPSIHLPFLSGKQLSILSALAITRRFGSSG
jgi:hypothetical protein